MLVFIVIQFLDCYFSQCFVAWVGQIKELSRKIRRNCCRHHLLNGLKSDIFPWMLHVVTTQLHFFYSWDQVNQQWVCVNLVLKAAHNDGDKDYKWCRVRLFERGGGGRNTVHEALKDKNNLYCSKLMLRELSCPKQLVWWRVVTMGSQRDVVADQ
jgi:hypothetical protein